VAASRVLVIDDDKLTRWSLSQILSGGGYDVYGAATLQEGAATLAQDLPDLIFLDIRLPDGDGFSLLKTIRQRHPNLPVIMITAHASQDTAQIALALGAVAHLAKPCGTKELQETVRAALEV
jgi:DNA-binding NtrC family response regulator